MPSYFNARRKLEFLILAFLILFAFAAMGDEWIGWATIISMYVVLMIVDFMFMDESSFIFEPDIKNYMRRVGAPQ